MSQLDPAPDALRYIALNCSLKRSPESSSTDIMLGAITNRLHEAGLEGTTVRVIDANVAFGVTADEGDGDGWPAIRQQILDAQLLVLGTPIWLGHPASIAQVVLERLDAFLGETDDRKQLALVDRVAVVGVVGNEDGAHHVGAELFQGLNDVGFTLPPGAMAYWVGEAMHSTDLKDLDDIPEKTMSLISSMITNAVHLTRRLAAEASFPALS